MSKSNAAVAGSKKSAATLDREVSQRRRKAAEAPAPAAVVTPLWQVRCAVSAMKKFEASGKGTDLFSTYKLIYPSRYSDTSTMAGDLVALIESNAARL